MLFVVYKSGSGSGKSTEDRIQWLDEKNKTISNDPQKTTQKMEEQETTENRGDLKSSSFPSGNRRVSFAKDSVIQDKLKHLACNPCV